MNRFPALRFAVAAGIFLSLHAVAVTLGAMAGIPGMRPFAELLTQFYGPYGYSISGTGIIAGALLGFSEGLTRSPQSELSHYAVRQEIVILKVTTYWGSCGYDDQYRCL